MYKSFLLIGFTLSVLICGGLSGAIAQGQRPAQSQDAPAATESEGVKGATVEGVVMNDLTSEPLRRAEVQLFKISKDAIMMGNDSPNYSAVTVADGKFKIEKIEAGEYRVQTRRTGYVNVGKAFGASSSILKLVAGESVKALRYVLVPQAIVNGRVVDDEGEPVQKASVSLVRQFYEHGGSRRMMPVGTAETNDKGEFRIINFQTGRYYLRASLQQRGMMGSNAAPSPVATAPGAPRMGFIATFYPSGAQLAQATRVEIKAGTEVSGQDITLRKERIFRLSGKILNPDGSAGKQAMVLVNGVEARMGGMLMFRPADDKGTFTVDDLPAGEYSVMVSWMGGGGSRDSKSMGWADVTITDADVKDLVIQTQPSLEVSGAFVIEGSDRKDIDFSSVILNAAPTGSDFLGMGQATVKADGSFTLENIAARKYRLNTFFRNQAMAGYISAIHVGSEDVLGREVDGTAMASGGIRIVYRLDVAGVTGTVELPESDAGLKTAPTVLLYPTDARLRAAGQIDRESPDQKGAFTGKNLRPGEYMAIAFDSIDSTLVEDPEFYAAIVPMATRVTLKPGESQSLSLKLQSVPAQFADR